jgi:hypothetical protein
MKSLLLIVAMIAFTLSISPTADAKGRRGSHRVGGHNSHGKGSHYVGGHR